MSDIFLPLLLTFAALITALATYRGIRKGGARFYTLEREAMLRRATFSLISTVLLFAAAIGLLIYDRQQIMAEDAAASGETVEGIVTGTPASALETFPPTITVTPTPDLSVPTATPTATICRAVVEGTSGNGLTLRDSPGGAELEVLPDGSILTLLEDEAVAANDFTWRKVRIIGGDEGWVAQEFIRIAVGCQ